MPAGMLQRLSPPATFAKLNVSGNHRLMAGWFPSGSGSGGGTKPTYFQALGEPIGFRVETEMFEHYPWSRSSKASFHQEVCGRPPAWGLGDQ
jgi:hypothetical protein